MSKRPKNHLLPDYLQWLERLGYATSTVNTYYRLTQQFMNWLSAEGHSLHQLRSAHLLQYESWLHQKPNEVRGGGLSIAMIRSSLQVLHNFADYLLYQEGQQIPVPDLSRVSLKQRLEIHYEVLTQEEIHQLYEQTYYSDKCDQDRAMLSIYYGCGLRRREGLQLEKEDINWKRQYLHVRKGKGGKDRIIPFTGRIAQDLKSVTRVNSKQLLSCCGQTALSRLQRLAAKAQIDKQVTLHGLRHSIATHLLEQGLSLEQIRVFLGHSSLETTQVYAHLRDTSYAHL